MAITKHSRQRDAILAELRSRYDHPTADELYFTLKKEMPNLSLGTVYRNLNLLSEEDIILKLSVEGADRFDANTNNHYHMLCTRCGHMIDVDFPPIEGLEEKAQSIVGGDIKTHLLTFIGVCKNCLH